MLRYPGAARLNSAAQEGCGRSSRLAACLDIPAPPGLPVAAAVTIAAAAFTPWPHDQITSKELRASL